jgi:tellurite methyltransferase
VAVTTKVTLACACFWGLEPGSFVTGLLSRLASVSGLEVLDAGCGEGKNAHAFAARKARVVAVDCSELAIAHARATWHDDLVTWLCADIRDVKLETGRFDVVVAYGLLHCLENRSAVSSVLAQLMQATRPGGYNVVCSFNDRRQDLSAHPGFTPCLLPHTFFLDTYNPWLLLEASDRDLHETHPHNGIPHVHSMTRLLVRRPE